MLQIERLSVRYGPIQALDGIDLKVEPGQIVTLLGANGAGKTSLLRTVSGLERSVSGRVVFDGHDLGKVKPHEILALGLAHCPEGRHIFADLSVSENLEMGAFIVNDDKTVRENMDRVLTYFPILAERRRQKGGTLSGGEQQMLAVARAMMSSPRLLMLDEPSLGLAPKIIGQIFEMITRINKDEGVTIFLVEQNANEALLHADYGYILEQGAIIMQGPAEALRHDPKVIEAYLGI